MAGTNKARPAGFVDAPGWTDQALHQAFLQWKQREAEFAEATTGDAIDLAILSLNEAERHYRQCWQRIRSEWR